MEFVEFCLPTIEFVFVILYFCVTMFFKGEKLFLHRKIIATIAFISYVLDVFIASERIGLKVVCAIIWGINTLVNSFNLKWTRRVTEIEEETKKEENQLK